MTNASHAPQRRYFTSFDAHLRRWRVEHRESTSATKAKANDRIYDVDLGHDNLSSAVAEADRRNREYQELRRNLLDTPLPSNLARYAAQHHRRNHFA
jgi:hypothetical protein